MMTREELEKREEQILASYAMKSGETRGRKYEEEPPRFRTHYQRDRDRIIHSTAFRRLEYKTQVFVNHEGDYYRTRLTHTIEVQQVARTIARALRLNEDLTEAISLAHDIGHTPFGHAGEEMLHELMKDDGGFEHNLQGLRVVDVLEEKYPDFPGLNLTYETREGIIKHKTSYDAPSPPPEFDPSLSPTLEAQVVNIADEIAYNSHDLDDGLKAGYLTLEQLDEVPLWREIFEKIKIKDKEKRIYATVRMLISMQIEDVIRATEERIRKLGIESVEDVRHAPVLVGFSEEMEEKNKKLKEFLMKNLYRHYKVLKMQEKAKRYIKALFDVYLSEPRQLPEQFQKRIGKDGKKRVICDYIAGMTDRFAQEEYARLFLPYEKM
ncbi:deoxyguanosinetriphosphate triphosphohydrolase [bacterium]|nr:MAG: deoxyguanosinetriphosphate triphosphohydrolase [bacterium]